MPRLGLQEEIAQILRQRGQAPPPPPPLPPRRPILPTVSRPRIAPTWKPPIELARLRTPWEAAMAVLTKLFARPVEERLFERTRREIQITRDRGEDAFYGPNSLRNLWNISMAGARDIGFDLADSLDVLRRGGGKLLNIATYLEDTPRGNQYWSTLKASFPFLPRPSEITPGITTARKGLEEFFGMGPTTVAGVARPTTTAELFLRGEKPTVVRIPEGQPYTEITPEVVQGIVDRQDLTGEFATQEDRRAFESLTRANIAVQERSAQVEGWLGIKLTPENIPAVTFYLANDFYLRAPEELSSLDLVASVQDLWDMGDMFYSLDTPQLRKAALYDVQRGMPLEIFALKYEQIGNEFLSFLIDPLILIPGPDILPIIKTAGRAASRAPVMSFLLRRSARVQLDLQMRALREGTRAGMIVTETLGDEALQGFTRIVRQDVDVLASMGARDGSVINTFFADLDEGVTFGRKLTGPGTEVWNNLADAMRVTRKTGDSVPLRNAIEQVYRSIGPDVTDDMIKIALANPDTYVNIMSRAGRMAYAAKMGLNVTNAGRIVVALRGLNTVYRGILLALRPAFWMVNAASGTIRNILRGGLQGLRMTRGGIAEARNLARSMGKGLPEVVGELEAMFLEGIRRGTLENIPFPLVGKPQAWLKGIEWVVRQFNRKFNLAEAVPLTGRFLEGSSSPALWERVLNFANFGAVADWGTEAVVRNTELLLRSRSYVIGASSHYRLAVTNNWARIQARLGSRLMSSIDRGFLNQLKTARNPAELIKVIDDFVQVKPLRQAIPDLEAYIPNGAGQAVRDFAQTIKNLVAEGKALTPQAIDNEIGKLRVGIQREFEDFTLLLRRPTEAATTFWQRYMAPIKTLRGLKASNPQMAAIRQARIQQYYVLTGTIRQSLPERFLIDKGEVASLLDELWMTVERRINDLTTEYDNLFSQSAGEISAALRQGDEELVQAYRLRGTQLYPDYWTAIHNVVVEEMERVARRVAAEKPLRTTGKMVTAEEFQRLLDDAFQANEKRLDDLIRDARHRMESELSLADQWQAGLMESILPSPAPEITRPVVGAERRRIAARLGMEEGQIDELVRAGDPEIKRQLERAFADEQLSSVLAANRDEWARAFADEVDAAHLRGIEEVAFSQIDYMDQAIWKEAAGQFVPFIAWPVGAVRFWAVEALKHPWIPMQIYRYRQLTELRREIERQPRRFQNQVPMPWQDWFIEQGWLSPGQHHVSIEAFADIFGSAPAFQGKEPFGWDEEEPIMRILRIPEFGLGLRYYPWWQTGLDVLMGDKEALPASDLLPISKFLLAAYGIDIEEPLRVLRQGGSDLTAIGRYYSNLRLLDAWLLYREQGIEWMGGPMTTERFRAAVSNPDSADFQAALAEVRDWQAKNSVLRQLIPFSVKSMGTGEIAARRGQFLRRLTIESAEDAEAFYDSMVGEAVSRYSEFYDTPEELRDTAERERNMEVYDREKEDSQERITNIIRGTPGNVPGVRFERRTFGDFSAGLFDSENNSFPVINFYASPEEASQKLGEYILLQMLGDRPDAEDYADLDGFIDWDTFDEAQKDWEESITLGRHPLLRRWRDIIALSVDIENQRRRRAGRPELGIEVIDAAMRIATSVDSLAVYEARNMTPAEALQRTWQEQYVRKWQEQWSDCFDKEGGARRFCLLKTREATADGVQASGLIAGAQEKYPDLFTEAQLAEEATRIGEFPGLDGYRQYTWREDQRARQDVIDAFEAARRKAGFSDEIYLRMDAFWDAHNPLPVGVGLRTAHWRANPWALDYINWKKAYQAAHPEYTDVLDKDWGPKNSDNIFNPETEPIGPMVGQATGEASRAGQSYLEWLLLHPRTYWKHFLAWRPVGGISQEARDAVESVLRGTQRMFEDLIGYFPGGPSAEFYLRMLEYAERNGIDTAMILANLKREDPAMYEKIRAAILLKQEEDAGDGGGTNPPAGGSLWNFSPYSRRPRVVRPRRQAIPWYDRGILSRRIVWQLAPKGLMGQPLPPGFGGQL